MKFQEEGGHLGLPEVARKILGQGQGQKEKRQKGSHGSVDGNRYFLTLYKFIVLGSLGHCTIHLDHKLRFETLRMV